MTARKTTCVECGTPLAQQPGPGRPAKYCSPVCRRSAEYSLRRAQSLLKRAEQRLQDCQFEMAVCDEYKRRGVSRRIEFWAGEVDRLKREMRSALADGTSGDVVERTA
jgi:hypothetical protein